MRKTSDGGCSIGRSASDERVAQATRAKQTIATQLVLWQRTRLDDTTRSAVVEDACLPYQQMVAARFHARDQWNEMKKTSNIEDPTPKGSSPARIPELAFCPPAAQPPFHQRLHLLHRHQGKPWLATARPDNQLLVAGLPSCVPAKPDDTPTRYLISSVLFVAW